MNLQNLDLVLVPSDVHGCMIPEEFEKSLVTDHPALVVRKNHKKTKILTVKERNA